MKNTVVFKFSVNQKVKNIFGQKGIVEMCAIDESGNSYYVKTSSNSGWMREDQLKAGW